MGCNCKEKRNLVYIKNLAKRFTKVSKQDVQIFWYLENRIKRYNFEPINGNRKNVIEIIKWQEVE